MRQDLARPEPYLGNVGEMYHFVENQRCISQRGSILHEADELVCAHRVPGSPYTNWFVLAFLILVAMLLDLDKGTRVALYVAPFWFTLLGIGYQTAKRRAAKVRKE